MKRKRLTIPERRRAARERAMPEVKRLVAKYGRQIVGGCVAQLREYEKTLKRLESGKQEVSRLEKQVN